MQGHAGRQTPGVPRKLHSSTEVDMILIFPLSVRGNLGYGSFLRTYLTPIVNAIIAFCTCIRFSAWSYTTDCGPSITASVTSTPRSAGRQCIYIASSFASDILRSLQIQCAYCPIVSTIFYES